MKLRFFLPLAVPFFFAVFFAVVGTSAVSAAEYCSHDYSLGVGVGRCEQNLTQSNPYNPWRYLSASDKQIKNESSSVSSMWPTSSSGKFGTRFCVGGVCAPFFPKVIESIVKKGEANKDAICKGFGSNVYTTCADVNVAIQGKPARYEWGTIIRTDGSVPQNWNTEYWRYYYYPQYYKYSSTYPCGYWSGYASIAQPKPYYAPGRRVIQTLSKTVNMPDVYNFHTEYLHLARGLQLCVLRLFTDTGAYQDNWVWLYPQWPSPASVKTLTVNGQESRAWIAPGESTRIDWSTERTTQVDVTSNQGDIPEELNDPYNYNGNITNLHPYKDTTYSVRARNGGGSDSKSVEAKINKPIILGFTANGIKDKIIIFAGQEVRLDWATDSAEEIWINGLDSKTNSKIKTYTSGNVTSFKPGSTATYTLRAWNQQWGFADEQSLRVEVEYIDWGKAAKCSVYAGYAAGVGAIASLVTTSSVLMGCAGVGALLSGPAAPIGAIIGALGCWLGETAIYTVGVFVGCYFGIDFNPAELGKAIPKKGNEVPSFLQGIQNPPPSWKPPTCPTCSVTITNVPPPPTIKTTPPGGWALVYDGGADPVANALQKRNAEIGSWKNGTEEVSTLQALKDQGIQYVKVLGSLPNHETVQEIRGLCGRLISCLTNRMNATLGYPNGDASSQLDVRKKWTDADVKKLFGIP